MKHRVALTATAVLMVLLSACDDWPPEVTHNSPAADEIVIQSVSKSSLIAGEVNNFSVNFSYENTWGSGVHAGIEFPLETDPGSYIEGPKVSVAAGRGTGTVEVSIDPALYTSGSEITIRLMLVAESEGFIPPDSVGPVFTTLAGDEHQVSVTRAP